MRSLASVQKIIDIQPIEGADRIEVATILGWQVVVKKDEYKIGDLVVYVEIDSKLPDKPEFEFMRERGFKVKTIKLRKQLSQGLILPIDSLPNNTYNEGDDVTEIIGVTQYNKDLEENELKEVDTKKYKNPIIKYLLRYGIVRKILLPQRIKFLYPDFISKTDETRIQNMSHILKNKDIKYIVREKLDGTSATYFLRRLPKKWYHNKQEYDFGVCSRNLRLKEDDSVYWRMAKKYDIKNILIQLIERFEKTEYIALQGEILAPKVQGNKYKMEAPDLFLFNYITSNGKHTCHYGINTLNNFNINFKWCPLINHDFILPDSMQELLEMADGKSKLYDTNREGLVFRNYEHNISFKVISNKFLLKNGE